MVAMPPNPPEEERGPRTVSPVQFLDQPPSPLIPEGTKHPSENLSHNFTLNDQEVELPEEVSEYSGGDDDEEARLAEADDEPNLLDPTNAQKSSAIDT